jgi:NAD(P)-dependent dehydrogenase (short-subunit alcohol dehydrogenase family)
MRLLNLALIALLCAAGTAVPAAAADDKETVLITGANRGIGLELARQYAADGWHVIGTARRPDAADELRATGASIVQLDVADADSVARMAEELAGEPIDVLINNAGILPQMRTLADIDFDKYQQVLAVNTVGPARVTQALLPNMRAGNLKKILNTTSGLGSIADNTGGGFYGYRESKAALNMFTKTIANELGSEGFVCIVMNPGWVQTDMGGPDAAVKVEDSAAGIRSVIANVAAKDNGTFWTFEGEQQAW